MHGLNTIAKLNREAEAREKTRCPEADTQAASFEQELVDHVALYKDARTPLSDLEAFALDMAQRLLEFRGMHKQGVTPMWDDTPHYVRRESR